MHWKKETISFKLSEFVHDFKLNSAPPLVVEKAKFHVLDTLGVMLAACTLENVQCVVRLCRLLGGPPDSTVVGNAFKAAASNAVMPNATMAHSLDYDDTHLGSVHQGCLAVPTSFAMGERVDASGKEVLEAVIVAYEANARLGLAANGKLHPRGFHPTPVIGVFGSALAAGKLAGLEVEKLVWALGIAGSLVSGISQTVLEGVPVKALHPAFATHNGIIASLLAADEYVGPQRIFEGEAGVFNVYLKGEECQIDKATMGLSERWETLNTSIKPYPTCHATHSTIDATLALKEKHNVEIEDVEECICYLPKYAMELVDLKPSTVYGAKFSIYYCLAAALKRGQLGLKDFTREAIKDKQVLEAISKIKLVNDETYDDEKYRGRMIFPARVRIRTKEGKTYEEEVIDHKGTPGNPLTREEVTSKFLENIKFSKPEFEDGGKEIVKKVISMENRSIKEIMEMLAN